MSSLATGNVLTAPTPLLVEHAELLPGLMRCSSIGGLVLGRVVDLRIQPGHSEYCLCCKELVKFTAKNTKAAAALVKVYDTEPAVYEKPDGSGAMPMYKILANGEFHMACYQESGEPFGAPVKSENSAAGLIASLNSFVIVSELPRD